MKKLAALLAALALAAPAASLAAVLNDEVTSVKLKEADNTASQDTNSGSGVKTGHIQNKAVTGAKMADGTITATQLANGAVTDAKITGPISAAKLGAHSHAQADVSGLAAALAAKADLAKIYQRFANVVVVSQDGRGDFTDPVTAMAAITDASAAKPYLLKILPGTYPIATDFYAKPYVDIEGSGRDVTVITTAPGIGVTALLFLAAHMEVRDLSIVSDFTWAGIAGADGSVRNVSISLSGAGIGNNVLVGLQVSAQAGLVARIEGVDVTIRGGANAAGYGLYVPGGKVQARDLKIDVVGGAPMQIGLFGDGGSDLDLHNAFAEVTGTGNVSGIEGLMQVRMRSSHLAVQSGATAVGMRAQSADVAGSEILAAGPAAYATRTNTQGARIRLVNSQIQGVVAPPAYPTASNVCLGTYDENFAPVTCP